MNRRMTLPLFVVTIAVGLLALAAQAAAVEPSSVVAIARTPSGHGYWLMNAGGDVFSFGDALALGDFPAEEGAYTSLVATRSGKGLWAVTVGPSGVGGQVNTLGSARSFGNFASADDDDDGTWCCRGLVAPVNGRGLWAFSANGDVQSLGRAADLGDLPIEQGAYSALVPTITGKGLWGVTVGPSGVGGVVNTLGRARDFGDFASGDDPGTTCCPALVGLTNGRGLWAFSANGDVQSLGRAADLGDLPTPPPGDGYTSMIATPSSRGLFAVTESGRVGTLGDAIFLGDLTDPGACVSCVP